eukprot:5116496-Heterocapsa_arctica.AAC.1
MGPDRLSVGPCSLMVMTRASRSVCSSARDGVRKPLVNPSRCSRADRRGSHKGSALWASRVKSHRVMGTVWCEVRHRHIAP